VDGDSTACAGVANYDAAVAVMDAFRSPELWTPSVAEDAAVQAEKLAREQRRQAAWMEQQRVADLHGYNFDRNQTVFQDQRHREWHEARCRYHEEHGGW